jgi:DNA-binding CsgD family transcriptional regulator
MQVNMLSRQHDAPHRPAVVDAASSSGSVEFGQHASVAALGLALAHAVLDRVLIGVGVVNADLTVLYANSAAKAECRQSASMSLDGARLRIRDTARHADLVRAVAAAQRGRWSLVQLPGPGEATTLAIVPLPASDGLSPPGLVLVVFGLRQQTRTLAIEFFARAQGMTQAETRVLCALGEGLSPRQIADRHAVALSTIRSQIASVRERAGANSIVSLVRTLGELPPIMPAAMVVV